jgi:hypothetical protein
MAISKTCIQAQTIFISISEISLVDSEENKGFLIDFKVSLLE